MYVLFMVDFPAWVEILVLEGRAGVFYLPLDLYDLI